MKRYLKNRTIQSIFLTLIILVALVLANVQNASAFTLTVAAPDMRQCQKTTITATIVIDSGERIPIDNILLYIDGFAVADFEVDGSINSNSSPVTNVSLTSGSYSYDYGYGRAYGSGFQSGSNYSGNWSWGFGYGYGPVTLTYTISVNPSAMTPSVHTAQLHANLESSSDYLLSAEDTFIVRTCAAGGGGGSVPPEETLEPTATPEVTPTPTPTPALTPTPFRTPTPTPNGEPGQVTVGLFGNTFTWNMIGGVLQQDVDASSPNDSVNIHITSGTSMLGPDGQPLSSLTVVAVDPLPDPPEGGHVLAAFDFGPDGATFDPPIEITIAYDSSAVLPGEEVVVALYDEATGGYKYITGVLNPDGTATFTIDSFCIYAVLAVPEGTVPTSAAASAHHDNDTGVDWWFWVIIGVMALVVVILVIAIVVRLTRKGGTKSRKGSKSQSSGDEDDFGVGKEKRSKKQH